MTQMMMMVLVFGAIAVGVLKRCEWFQFCDTPPAPPPIYNYPAEEAKIKQKNKDAGIVEKEAEKTGLGNWDATARAIPISKTVLKPKTDVKATTIDNVNNNLDGSCTFQQECGALVRIWRGGGKDPCVPCGAAARYTTRSRFTRIAI